MTNWYSVIGYANKLCTLCIIFIPLLPFTSICIYIPYIIIIIPTAYSKYPK